jgi:hypothetical protein
MGFNRLKHAFNGFAIALVGHAFAASLFAVFTDCAGDHIGCRLGTAGNVERLGEREAVDSGVELSWHCNRVRKTWQLAGIAAAYQEAVR